MEMTVGRAQYGSVRTELLAVFMREMLFWFGGPNRDCSTRSRNESSDELDLGDLVARDSMAFRIKTSGFFMFWALVLPVLWSLAPAIDAWAEPPSQLLILPFHVEAGDGREDLERFGRRIDESIREAVKQFGDMLRVESEEDVKQLLQDGPPPSTEKDAVDLGEQAHADILIYGFLRKSDGRYHLKATMRDMRTGRIAVASDFGADNIRGGLDGGLKIFLYNVAKRIHGAPKLPLYRAGTPTDNGAPASKLKPSKVSLSRDRGPWMSPKITPMRGLEIGDLDGDKRNEVVFVGADGDYDKSL